MRAIEIEGWARRIVDRLESKQALEDSRVELKSSWIDPKKAARRLAGHANAAHGDSILWLVGVDEDKGVVGASNEDFPQWHASVLAEFDELPPRLVRDIVIPIKERTIVALLFETDRAPYVVRNPSYGKPEGGPVNLEVPWRDATSVRSARRSELLAMLLPLQTMPTFEVLGGGVTVRSDNRASTPEGKKLDWFLNLELYCTSIPDGAIVIPFHKSRIWLEVVQGREEIEFAQLSLDPPRRGNIVSRSTENKSLTVDSTENEVIISGPGLVQLRAHTSTGDISEHLPDHVRVKTRLFPIASERFVAIEALMDRAAPETQYLARWVVPVVSQ